MTAKLIYFATRSLDGYVEDAQGKIDDDGSDEEFDLVDQAGFPDGVRLGLELVDERRFDESGIVHVHYRVRSA